VAQNPPTFTAGERLVFRPGTPRVKVLLQRIPELRDIVASGGYAFATVDLDNDQQPEFVVQAASQQHCGRGGCATVVVQQQGSQQVVLLSQHLFTPLAVTQEKRGAFRALAQLDEQGRIAIGDRQDTPLFGRQMVYFMADPSAAATTPAPTAAEASAPAQSRIDVVGIRLGMPLKDALAVAKAHNPKLVWTAPPQGSFSLLPGQRFTVAVSGAEAARMGNGMGFTREHLTIEAMPGLGAEVVTGILRFMSFEDAPASRDQMLRSLEQKYGTAFDPRMSAEGLRLWLHDAQGQPLRHPEGCHTDYLHRSESNSGNLGLMNGPKHFADTMKRIDLLERQAPRCGTLAYATWVSNRDNPALVDTAKVYISDEVLRTTRLRAMADQLQVLNRAAQRQQAGEAARRPGPKF
jgi:hypothetical protein